MLGAYEINLKVAELEMGIPRDQIESILLMFDTKGKIIFQGGFIVVINWAKHQKLSKNMLKNSYSNYDNLKDEFKQLIPAQVIKQFQKLSSYAEEESLSKPLNGIGNHSKV